MTSLATPEKVSMADLAQGGSPQAEDGGRRLGFLLTLPAQVLVLFIAVFPLLILYLPAALMGEVGSGEGAVAEQHPGRAHDDHDAARRRRCRPRGLW